MIPKKDPENSLKISPVTLYTAIFSRIVCMGVRSYYMYPELLYIMWVQAVSVGEGVVCGMLETKRLVRVCVCVCVCVCGVESPPRV